MNIHEFQGKEIFRKFGIPVPTGRAAKSPAEAQQIATELGGPVWVVKAQIHAGGRGKGTLKEAPEVHGVHITKSVEAATQAAQRLLGNTLVTLQTGPAGQVVKQVLVEQGSTIARELYVGTVLDSDTSKVTFIISTEGGMDIEEVAANTPEKIITIAVDPTTGVLPYHTRRIAKALGLNKAQGKQAAVLFRNLYQAFIDSDASLVEINPLVVTQDGDLIALDAKLTFDSNALFRRPEIARLRDKDEEDPKEQDASAAGLSYVALDGNIGCLVNGAGLAMATMDIIKNVGGAPANFLDVGGSATTEQVTTALKIILADENVRAILVNIFGGIAKCDTIANGIIAAAREVGLSIPLIVRLAGTNVDLGKKILAESGLTIQSADDMLDAATQAVQAAGVAS